MSILDARRVELGQPGGELRLHRPPLVLGGGLGHVVARLPLGDGELPVEPVEQAPAQLQADLPLVEEGVVVGPAGVPAGVRAQGEAGPVRRARGPHVGAGRLGGRRGALDPRRLASASARSAWVSTAATTWRKLESSSARTRPVSPISRARLASAVARSARAWIRSSWVVPSVTSERSESDRVAEPAWSFADRDLELLLRPVDARLPHPDQLGRAERVEELVGRRERLLEPGVHQGRVGLGLAGPGGLELGAAAEPGEQVYARAERGVYASVGAVARE